MVIENVYYNRYAPSLEDPDWEYSDAGVNTVAAEKYYKCVREAVEEQNRMEQLGILEDPVEVQFSNPYVIVLPIDKVSLNEDGTLRVRFACEDPMANYHFRRSWEESLKVKEQQGVVHTGAGADADVDIDADLDLDMNRATRENELNKPDRFCEKLAMPLQKSLKNSCDSSRSDESLANGTRTDQEESSQIHDTQREISGRHSNVLIKFHQSTQLAKQLKVTGHDGDTSAQAVGNCNDKDDGTDKDASTQILHGLEPIPQQTHSDRPFEPSASNLPDWLCKPTLIYDTSLPNESKIQHASLESLDLDGRILSRLNSRCNISRAFPVQREVIPLLRRRSAFRHPGDMLIEAPTGSGKTLAYLLPIIESLYQGGEGHETELTMSWEKRKREEMIRWIKAVIVVPTRELVLQVRQMCEECLPSGSKVHVGMAMGSVALSIEQASLVKLIPRLNVAKARRIGREADGLHKLGIRPWHIFTSRLGELDQLEQSLDWRKGYVPEYSSQVDILVCTPGRLVEHITSTPGFSLRHVQWMVFDEADRLLEEETIINNGVAEKAKQHSNVYPVDKFHEWFRVINKAIHGASLVGEGECGSRFTKPKNASGFDDLPVNSRERDGHLASFNFLKSRVTKILLSATMTQSYPKLATLNLRRPIFLRVVTSREPTSLQTESHYHHATNLSQINLLDRHSFSVPVTLCEKVIPVGDGSEKPLYLAGLLIQHIFKDFTDNIIKRFCGQGETPVSTGKSDDSITSSRCESEDTSASSSEASETDSSKALSSISQFGQTLPTILIFTKTTSDAHRLAHVLKLILPNKLIPSLESNNIKTLTSLDSSSTRNSIMMTLKHQLDDDKGRGSGGRAKFDEEDSLLTKRGKRSKNGIVILITTSRGARGLDFPGMTHVINYDVPRTKLDYVHQVGRTARAGRVGYAWSLVKEKESWEGQAKQLNGQMKWFIEEIGPVKHWDGKWYERQLDDSGGRIGREINRASPIEYIVVKNEVVNHLRPSYLEALEGLKKAVNGENRANEG